MVAPGGAQHKVIDTRKSESPGQIRHQLDKEDLTARLQALVAGAHRIGG